MNKIILLGIIILLLLYFLGDIDYFEYFRIIDINDGLTVSKKPYDQYRCTDLNYFGWHIRWHPVTYFKCGPCWPIWARRERGPFTKYTPRWHYGLDTSKCERRHKYGIDNHNDLKIELERKYSNFRKRYKHYPSYNKYEWENNFFNNPEKLREGCCYLYTDYLNDISNKPCIKENEMSRHCDFYANHIYKDNVWHKVDRSKGEESECERVPELKKVCCHTCSL